MVCRSLRNRSLGVGLLRQGFAGLLGDDVAGVPVGPVGIGVADALFVLAVGGFSATKRACQIGCGSE